MRLTGLRCTSLTTASLVWPPKEIENSAFVWRRASVVSFIGSFTNVGWSPPAYKVAGMSLATRMRRAAPLPNSSRMSPAILMVFAIMVLLECYLSFCLFDATTRRRTPQGGVVFNAESITADPFSRIGMPSPKQRETIIRPRGTFDGTSIPANESNARSARLFRRHAVIDPGEALQWTQWDMHRIGWEVCNGA